MRVLSSLSIACIKGYQLFLSPYLGQHCRFSPTCSHYAVEAFQKHRFLVATTLTVKRIFKCHPWHPGGYDPLP